MNKIWIVLVIIIVILIIIIVRHRFIYDKFIEIYGDDGERYKILRGADEKSVHLLAWLNGENVKLMRFMKRKYPDRVETKLLCDRYDPAVISEHLPSTIVPETSYVENKGDTIAFCLRDGRNPSVSAPYTDKSTIMFVNLHEMSHIVSEGYGHKTPFWQTFKFLIQCAKEAKIYEPVDYSKHPFVYCGLEVAYNPYFDDTLSMP